MYWTKLTSLCQTGHATDTLKEHQERRGRVRVPDPTFLDTFSVNMPLPSQSRSGASSSRPPSVVQSAHRGTSRALVRTPSEYSDASLASSSWTIASNVSVRQGQRLGRDGHPRAVLVRKRRRTQAEMPTRPEILSHTEQTIVTAAQNILALDVVIHSAFPNKVEKPRLAREAYSQAYVEGGFRMF